MAGLRAFPVTGDCRIIYRLDKDELAFLFLDIGWHSHVYH
jgi:mRNA-degrading endonuclease YafQ of YafQ-DinJ toxin-antitoxin module